MSIATELQRIQGAKADIKSAIEAKGVTVPSNALIDSYDTYISNIPSGGGSQDLIDLIERDITSITIPSGTTKIGDYAFSNCTSLTSVTIPNSVTTIGQYAFNDCSGLTSVTIPNSVTSIGQYAFQRCSGLTSVTIPNSVTTINNGAFQRCIKLTNVIVPNYIQTVSQNVFDYCTSLPVENYVKYAGTWAFQSDKNQTSYTLRQDTTYLVGTFLSCTSITSVGEIGSGASVEIPNSVVAIGTNAFRTCTGLTSVTLPNTIIFIGGTSFNGCSNLTSFTIQATTPPTLQSTNAFEGTNNCPIYVPAASLSDYQSANNWSSLSSRIQAIPTT